MKFFLASRVTRYASRLLGGIILHLKVGEILDNRYSIITLVKIGGMSNIYKAEDKRLNKICAVKELIDKSDEPEESDYVIKRFREEAKLLAELYHTNLPRVSDYFIDGIRYYLVMDFIEGVDLETHLRKSDYKGLSEEQVVNWAVQLCDVLDYLHGQNPPIIYRDIKPANIMLRKGTDKIILVDFGIAKKIEPKGTITAIGTMEYAPLEQYQGKAEPRSDIYALGATMHHLLTAKNPVPFKFPPVRTIKEEISVELEDIIIKALSPKPAARFQTAKEMQGALLGLLASNKIGSVAKKVKKPEFMYDLEEARYMMSMNSNQLLEELKKGNKKAAFLLGEKKIKEAVDPLIHVLKNSDSALRGEAALALGKIGDPAAIPALMELLETEQKSTGNLKVGLALEQLRSIQSKKEEGFWDVLVNKIKEFFIK